MQKNTLKALCVAAAVLAVGACAFDKQDKIKNDLILERMSVENLHTNLELQYEYFMGQAQIFADTLPESKKLDSLYNVYYQDAYTHDYLIPEIDELENAKLAKTHEIAADMMANDEYVKNTYAVIKTRNKRIEQLQADSAYQDSLNRMSFKQKIKNIINSR